MTLIGLHSTSCPARITQPSCCLQLTIRLQRICGRMQESLPRSQLMRIEAPELAMLKMLVQRSQQLSSMVAGDMGVWRCITCLGSHTRLLSKWLAVHIPMNVYGWQGTPSYHHSSFSGRCFHSSRSISRTVKAMRIGSSGWRILCWTGTSTTSEKQPSAWRSLSQTFSRSGCCSSWLIYRKSFFRMQ